MVLFSKFFVRNFNLVAKQYQDFNGASRVMLARHDALNLPMTRFTGFALIDLSLLLRSMTQREMYQGVLRNIPRVPFRVPYFEAHRHGIVKEFHQDDVENTTCETSLLSYYSHYVDSSPYISIGETSLVSYYSRCVDSSPEKSSLLFADAHPASFGQMCILFCKTIVLDLNVGLAYGSKGFSTSSVDLKMRFIRDGHRRGLFRIGCLLPRWMSSENLDLPWHTKFLTEMDFMEFVAGMSTVDQWDFFLCFLKEDFIYVVEGTDGTFLKCDINKRAWYNPLISDPVANVDASVDEDGNAGVGVVIRSPEGVIENAFFMSLQEKMSSIRAAEVKAGELAILVASELGYDSLLIKSDSGDYVNGMNGQFRPRRNEDGQDDQGDLDFKKTCDVQKALAGEKFRSHRVVFCHRELNMVADYLSRIPRIHAKYDPRVAKMLAAKDRSQGHFRIFQNHKVIPKNFFKWQPQMAKFLRRKEVETEKFWRREREMSR